MLKAVKPEELSRYLLKIRRIFPTLRPERPLSNDDVKRYYEQSAAGYRLFHSEAGAIHMAISKDGTFNKNDYFRQGEAIIDVAQEYGERGAILEAGCGRGFNLAFIAAELPEWQCTGVDITPAHIGWAREHFVEPNLHFREGDFNDLAEMSVGKQQIVFCVESICHAQNLRLVLKAFEDILAPDGRVIIFDGFRSDSTLPTGEWQEAALLVEAAMAVARFPDLEEFRAVANESGLIVESEVDLSQAIMPNLIRLSDFAKSFFKIPPLTKLMVRVLPNGLVCNAVAGLLMPLTVSKRIHRYFKLVLRKKS